MIRNRFQKILQFLHFADNSNYDTTDPGYNKLFKVRDIVEFLVDRFKTVYIPSENISIDEELLLYKERLSFKQYIPCKRARFGIKLFSLCEDSDYLWNFFVYLGKTTINENQHQLERRLGKSGVAVNSLLSDLLGLNYKLLVDNWYMNETLFDYLYESKTSAVGTVRKNRLKLPESVTNEKLGRGQFTLRRKENMLVVRYQDKKEIYLLLTMHKADIVNVRKRSHGDVQKLIVIHDYNKKVGVVGKNDAMIGNYSCVRKTYKCYIIFFFHFLEEALYNAFVVYSEEGEKKITKFMLFKLEVIRQMLEDTPNTSRFRV